MAVCACEISGVEACSPTCTCRIPVLSGGCSRCATYGSDEQQLEAAKRIASADRKLATAKSEAKDAYKTTKYAQGRVDELLEINAKLEFDRAWARRTAEHWKAEHLAGNVEIDRLKALVSLEKRNLQQTIDTANVRLGLWKEYRELLSEELESTISVAYIHGWRSTPERVAKGQELRTKLGIASAEDFKGSVADLPKKPKQETQQSREREDGFHGNLC